MRIHFAMWLVVFATLVACGSPSSKPSEESSPAQPTVASEPQSVPTQGVKQSNLQESTSLSITRPVAELQPDELKAVEELCNDILFVYFYGTRENGNINIWLAPKRMEVIREGAQYAQSTKTIYMYPSPSTILHVKDNRIAWKSAEGPKLVKLNAPLTLDVYSFALKVPVSQSISTIVSGLLREAKVHAAVYIAEKGQHYRVTELLVDVMEGVTAPDGSKLHEISLFPLTIEIESK